MTLRAVIFGLLLGTLIAGATYFNDHVVRQTPLVGNLLPIAVFAVAALLVLAWNPLAWRVSRRLVWRASEVAVMAAIALAACGWPGTGFFRFFAANQAMPAHWIKTNPSWRTHQVLSYVPSGAPDLAEGFVRDWPGLIQSLTSPQALPIWSRLDEDTRHVVHEAAASGTVGFDGRRTVLAALNRVIHGETLDADDVAVDPPHARAWGNRRVLERLLPGHVLAPPPMHEGVLLLGGREDERVTGPLVMGRPEQAWHDVSAVPWDVWWPVIRFWGGIALLLGLAYLCVIVIVHPQWTRHEQLAYPIARFVEELSQQDDRGGWPTIARDRLFLGGMITVMLLHLTNGLATWYPGYALHVSLRFDFTPLLTLWPSLAQTGGARPTFSPTLYPSVIAFTFFMTGAVALSLGLSQVVWVLLGATLMTRGLSIGAAADGRASQLLQLGACVGVAAVTAYTGRRHYAAVAARALGRGSAADAPGICAIAAWGLVACVAGVAWMMHRGGLPWPLGLTFVGCVMLMFVTLARVNAETGAFFVQIGFSPAIVLAAIFGFEHIGPTAFVVLSLASFMLVPDQRQALIAFVANGLRMVDRPRAEPSSPPIGVPRIVPLLAAMIVLSFAVALVTTLVTQHRLGVDPNDWIARQAIPHAAFDNLAQQLAAWSATDALSDVTARTQRFAPSGVAWDGQVLLWLGVGVTLVVTCGLLRLRVAWWPIHPVLFVVWGTYPAIMFFASFLIGWVIKVATLRLVGARGYRTLKPLMVGVIVGELLAALAWLIAGAAHYLLVGVPPARYAVFPG
jgi:hypothetical protein